MSWFSDAVNAVNSGIDAAQAAVDAPIDAAQAMANSLVDGAQTVVNAHIDGLQDGAVAAAASIDASLGTNYSAVVAAANPLIDTAQTLNDARIDFEQVVANELIDIPQDYFQALGADVWQMMFTPVAQAFDADVANPDTTHTDAFMARINPLLSALNV